MITERVVPGPRGPVAVTVDEGHVAAHLADLALPLAEALEAAVRALDGHRDGEAAVSVDLGRPVGRSRLVRLGPGDRPWWGLRPGRSTPSHLVAGTPRETTVLTVGGRWRGPDRLELDTLFPGEGAPREIHDPALPLDEIDAAIAFWTTHALVTGG